MYDYISFDEKERIYQEIIDRCRLTPDMANYDQEVKSLKKLLRLNYDDLDIEKILVPELIQTTVLKINRALVGKGKPIGFTAAEAISQPTIQMTLNSVDYEEEINYMYNGYYWTRKIGKFVDKLMGDSKEIYKKVVDKIKVPAINIKTGKVTWSTLIGVSRHVVINEDGSSDLLLVKTKSTEVRATAGHSFLVEGDDESYLKVVRGGDLEVGDMLPVVSCAKVAFEPILSIEKVKSSHQYVYDFTVKENTFILNNGLAVHNTFHSVGSGKQMDSALKMITNVIEPSTDHQGGIGWVYFNRKYTMKQIVDKNADFRQLYFKDVIFSTQITDEKYKQPWWYESAAIINDIDLSKLDTKKILIFYLKKKELFISRLTTLEVAAKINNIYLGHDEKIDVSYRNKFNSLLTDFQKIHQTASLKTQGFYILASPDSVGEIHVIPNIKKLSRGVQDKGVTIDELVSVFLVSVVRDGLSNMFIKGIKGVFSISHASTDIWPQVNNITEVKPTDYIKKGAAKHKKYFILELNEYPAKFHGIDSLSLIDLCKHSKDSDGVQHLFAVKTISDRKLIIGTDGRHPDDIYSALVKADEKIKQKLKDKSIFGHTTEFELYRKINYGTIIGGNLKQILLLPDVNPYLTWADSVFQMFKYFGIEAARNTIVRFLFYVYEENGVDNIDPRHVKLIGDAMTTSGLPLSVTYNGRVQGGNSIFALMAFERAEEVIKTRVTLGGIDSTSNTDVALITGKDIYTSEDRSIQKEKDINKLFSMLDKGLIDEVELRKQIFKLRSMEAEKEKYKIIETLPAPEVDIGDRIDMVDGLATEITGATTSTADKRITEDLLARNCQIPVTVEDAGDAELPDFLKTLVIPEGIEVSKLVEKPKKIKSKWGTKSKANKPSKSRGKISSAVESTSKADVVDLRDIDQSIFTMQKVKSKPQKVKSKVFKAKQLSKSRDVPAEWSDVTFY